jgi:hypothetical protein
MMMMMMIVMMMAMTPRIEARLSPFCLIHIACACRSCARRPGQAADARAKTGEAATSRSHRPPVCESISA